MDDDPDDPRNSPDPMTRFMAGNGTFWIAGGLLALLVLLSL